MPKDKVIMFTHYSPQLVDLLKAWGNDVSRIEERVATGEKLTFISSHYRCHGGWDKGIGCTSNPQPGEYLDECALWVNPNTFFEWHGAPRYRNEGR